MMEGYRFKFKEGEKGKLDMDTLGFLGFFTTRIIGEGTIIERIEGSPIRQNCYKIRINKIYQQKNLGWLKHVGSTVTLTEEEMELFFQRGG